MAIEKPPTSYYPEGDAYDAYVAKRQRAAKFWLAVFFGATLVGIFALIVLGYDITNKAFGYIALRYKVEPEVLIADYYKNKMTTLPSTLASEDDQVLVKGVAARPSAIGFFGYSFYQNNAESLRTLTVDGIEPAAGTVESGEYPFARPLYLYSSDALLTERPQTAAFLYYYLTNVQDVVDDVGYFQLSGEDVEAALVGWSEATGLTAETAETLLPATGDILVTGSSTLAPLTQRLADDFAASGQFDGQIVVNNIGTDAGFRQFCIDGEGDIVNASRPSISLDQSACQRSKRPLVAFHVANDGIPIVVSAGNQFLNDLTKAQLQQIFLGAQKWSDIDPSWPEETIFRFIPGVDSGTLDFFVASLFGTTFEEQPATVLAEILAANVTAGRLNALAAEKPLAERSQAELTDLLNSEVVRPYVEKSWNLVPSILDRQAIEAEVASMPGADLVFKSWVSWEFITSPQSSDPLKAGVSVAIWGSLYVIVIAALVAVPIGVAAAIYLEEYSSGKSRFDQLIETNINNLAGVPSIIYGMLGLAVFVRYLGPLTSGLIVGYGDPSTANGRTILSAGFTLGLLVLPLVIINAREAIRAVPRALREASYGIGATRWQTVWNHVLPNAIPGILTGVILSVARAFGETAPLIVVGVSTFIVVRPDSVFSKYTTLPAQIYQWTSRPQPEFQHLAAAAIIVLLVLLLALNAFAIWMRNRYSRRVL